MSKCVGCGIELQNVNCDEDGYVSKEDHNLCMRCFKIKNYGVNKITKKNNIDYVKIFDNIHDDDLVVYVSSLLTLDLSFLDKFKNVILVLTKRDILPKSVKEEKIIKYLSRVATTDKVIVSAYKKYNLDKLYEMMKKYGNGKKIYFVGNTNSGKSTLINEMIKSYNGKEGEITVSNYPSTTLDIIPETIGDLTIYDTPGMLIDDSIINYIDTKDMKKINSKKEIKPVNFQVNGEGSVLIDELIRVDYETLGKSSITVYMANNLRIVGTSINNKKLRELENTSDTLELDNQDVVISDMGFIKMTGRIKIKMSYNNTINYKIRKNLI